MPDLLDHHTFFVKEHVGMMKLTDTYDILNIDTQEKIGIAKESPGTLTLILKMLLGSRMLPTTVHVYQGEAAEGTPVVSIKKGAGIFSFKVSVLNSQGETIGWFKSKIFSLGGGFHVYDRNGEKVADVKGDWKGWNFKFLSASGDELGTVSKKWAGGMKELFTSADNYVIALNGEPNPGLAALLLAAGLSIDIILKEND